MAESTLKKLTRIFNGAVIAPYKRNSILRLIEPEIIGDEGVITWAKRILKEVSEPAVREHGGNWNPPEEGFDITSIELIPYDLQKRIVMNRTELRLFTKNGVLPIGIDEVGSKMARVSNELFFLGPPSNGQYNKTNNQYVTKDSTASTDYADPSIITTATKGKWDAAGQVQLDAANLAGMLKKYGYNPATSIIFYPEVCAPVFERPVVTGSSIYGDKNIMQMFMDHGFLGAIPVRDALLYTDAGANPTVEAFDIYAVDFAQLVSGYIEIDGIPGEQTSVIDDIINKRTLLDFQNIFTPLFKPRLYDDGYIYKGVVRITACDANT